MVHGLYRWALRKELQTRHGGHRFLQLLAALDPSLKSVPVRCDGGAHIYIDVTRPTLHTKQLFTGELTSTYEPHVQDIFRRYLTKADVAVDVGANLGLHAVALSRYAGKVIAVEANSTLWPGLRRTSRELGNVQLFECAAGARDGYVSLEIPGEDHAQGHVVDGAQIPLKKLDDIITEPVRLIKIDVEGYEHEVLQGLAKTIRESHPVIVFEELEWNPPLARTYLTKNDYECTRLDDKNYLAVWSGEAHAQPRRT
jgi:FkbM family methyltransferase